MSEKQIDISIENIVASASLDQKIDQEREKVEKRKVEFRQKVAAKREEAAAEWQEFGGDLEEYYETCIRDTLGSRLV